MLDPKFILYEAAVTGNWSRIPESIQPQDLTAHFAGLNFLAHAASVRKLCRTPLRLVTEQGMVAKNPAGMSALEILLSDSIPGPESMHPEKEVIPEAWKRLILSWRLPTRLKRKVTRRPSLTEDQLEAARVTKIVINAAISGDWGVLPKGFLREDHLLLLDSLGWGAIHYAAAEGMLHRIPRELLSERVLTAAVPGGCTALGLLSECEWQNVPVRIRSKHQRLLSEEVRQQIREYFINLPLSKLGWGHRPQLAAK